MRDPLQSKNDNDNIPPFNLNIVMPTIDTTTGCEDLLSGSGGAIRIGNTEPRLVPTQRVGVGVGSKKGNLLGLRLINSLCAQTCECNLRMSRN